MMKINNISIRARLIWGFGVVLVFVVILGATSLNFVDRLWNNTRRLYEHPFHVSNAAESMQADMSVMQRSMKGIILAENDSEIESQVIIFNQYKTNVYKSFDLIYERYLGDKNDIDSLYADFRKWEVITDHTINLVRRGEKAEARKRVMPNGVEGSHVDKMMKKVDKLVSFAHGKAESFYQSAMADRNTVVTALRAIVILIFLISFILVILLIRSIRRPIYSLVVIAEQFREGNYTARSADNSTNEIGLLAGTYNKLAQTIEQEITLKSSAAGITNKLSSENELFKFGELMLRELVMHTGAQMASFFVRKDDEERYNHIFSIGISGDSLPRISTSLAEGEFSKAFAMKTICTIDQVDENSPFVFTTFTGTMLPKTIVTIPLFQQETPVAAISLAGIQGFTPMTEKLLVELHPFLTARVNAVISHEIVVSMLRHLDAQNIELEQQAGELNVQTDELKEYNIELEMQKKQLDETNRLKSAFLSNMSHELRTPLNSVIALSGVLIRKLKDKIDEEDFSYLDVIGRNGKSLLTLINEILDLSRIEAGKEELLVSRFSIAELIEELVMVIKPSAEEKELNLINNASADPYWIQSDRDKCRHILLNILANAIKFTEKGQVEVSVIPKEDHLQVVIHDTGIGIEDAHIPVIFDEFRQADERTARKFGGSGLGLAIARKYSEMLGGNIVVESKLGKGSVFRVIIPYNPVDNQYTTMELPVLKRNNQQLPVRDKNKCILIVEDSEPQIVQLKDVLMNDGYVVQVSTSGNEALESMRKSMPDGIILDLMMPGMDGFEVLKQIRKEFAKVVPVLILTAKHVTKEEMSTLKGNNINQLIQKGELNLTELLQRVDGMFGTGEEPAKTNSDPKQIIRKAGDPTILLIEDNLDNSLSIQALLGDQYFLLTAEDGLSGLEKARNFKPHLILLDISLPGLDGFEVLKGIRETESIQDTPVIAVTAMAMKGDKEKLLEFGFDAYIPKPIDNELFEATIKQVLYGN